jgi:pyruvate dehydrogenase E2 component (dihydrolipoamide acetyltransferase)
VAEFPDVTSEFAEFGIARAEKLTRLQKLVGDRLAQNWVSIPHVTHHDLIDITSVEARRASWQSNAGVRLTLLPLLLKALAQALVRFPRFNASLRGEWLVLKEYIHLGVAVDTPDKLLIPVIRDCNLKAVSVIATELSLLSERARSKGLSMAEMSGGCMTISSLGGIGGTAFTPIINAPEVAILGVCKAEWTPRKGLDDAVEWKLMLPVSLSYDHRVVNGASAARFVRHLAEGLSDVSIN